MERAILLTSPVAGEPPTNEQFETLVAFAEERGIEIGWHVPSASPIPGRAMVKPRALRHLPEAVDVVLFTENGRPVAWPVR